MKIAVVIMVTLLLFIPHTERLSASKDVTLLIELPDGEIYWGKGVSWLYTTLSILKNNSISFKINGENLSADGFSLSPYHWDGKWKSGFSGNVLAWSDGYPSATPKYRYPLTTSEYRDSFYTPGNTLLWTTKLNNSNVITAGPLGFQDLIFIGSTHGLISLNSYGRKLWENNDTGKIISMIIYNSTIYTVSNKSLSAVNYAGKTIWEKKISNNTIKNASLSAAENVLYVRLVLQNSSEICAFTDHGVRLWNHLFNSKVTDIEYHGGSVYFSYMLETDGGVGCIKNAAIKWIYNTSAVSGLTTNNGIYFTTLSGFFYHLSYNGTTIDKYNEHALETAPVYYRNSTYFVTKNGFDSFSNNSIQKLFSISALFSAFIISPPFVFLLQSEKNSSEVVCYNFNGSKVWDYHVNHTVKNMGVIEKNLLLLSDKRIFNLFDSEIPKIVVQGNKIYQFGDMIRLTVYFYDNVGIRNSWVNYSGKSIQGVSTHIAITANFLGTFNFSAVAIDRSGNVARQLFSVMVFPMGMDVSLSSISFQSYKTENLTIIVKDDSGSLVNGANISVYIDNKKVIIGTTRNGYFSLPIYLSPGTHKIKVFVYKYGYENLTANFTIQSYENQKTMLYNYYIIYGIVAGFIIVAIFLAFLMKKKIENLERIEHEKMKNRKK